MRVALVYDRVNKWGGAERVLLALHKIFPDAPLYTSVYDPKKAPWASVFKVKTSFLQNLPFTMNHELFAALMPLSFESFDFDEFDLVISVTSEAAKGIITKPKTKHICYCLTPTRYLWSGYDEYFKNPVLKFISKPIVWYLRAWDKIAASRPDKYIAISKEVQRRVRKYYNRDSEVVYPPVDFQKTQNTQSFRRSDASEYQKVRLSEFSECSGNYFLIVSRLVPYKKIDLAVRAFNRLKLPLKIVGSGSEENKLKSMAGTSIELVGNLTDKELVGYYSGCKALIFPGIEDFGLTILEAQSFGKPVIAFRGGGALEAVIDPSASSGSATGIFFDEQTVRSLETAIKQFGQIKFDPRDCIDNSGKYSFERFKGQFLNEILK